MAELHITKVAVSCASLDVLRARIGSRAVNGVANVTTRYRPTRHAELIGGSLFWIVKHRLVARQRIVGFEELETERRWAIRVEAALVPVRPMPRRAHQGWRYLTAKDAPADIGESGDLSALPKELLDELAALALI